LRRAVLLSIDEHLEEMHALLRTVEISVEREVVQKRPEPHRSTFLGSGKVKEVVEDIADLDIDYVVVNGDLKPSQHHTLEMLFQKECMDRVGVILKIFAEHAHTEEAKNQVTLATLRYELPFLREWIHKAKSGERPGFLSGGAYATEVYYEHARSHIRRMEESLKDRSKQREIRRSMRRERGYYLVSLAGYTNAGKSALLNALSGSKELVDSILFSTLSTTTRQLKGSRRNVLLTDTVGFIRDLPPDLVNAFNSTLEEIFLADLILLVVDVSEPPGVIEEKVRTSLDVLIPRLEEGDVIIVGNKIDEVDPERLPEIRTLLESKYPAFDVVLLSASEGMGLDSLIDVIEAAENRTSQIHATLPLTDAAMSLLSELHDVADVRSTTTDQNVEVTLMCRPTELERITGKIRTVGGTVRAEPSAPAAGPAPADDGP
jgi:GTP-binding protein HflX